MAGESCRLDDMCHSRVEYLKKYLQVFKRKKSSLEEETSRYPKVFSGSVTNEEH